MIREELPHAKILRRYKKHGVIYTAVKCPICGMIHYHTPKGNPEGLERLSHCGGAIRSERYILSYHAEDMEPLASRQARFINRVLSGDLPSGLVTDEFGYNIDKDIVPPDSDRFGQLSRLINALDSYSSGIQL